MRNWKQWAIRASIAFNIATIGGLIFGAYENRPTTSGDLGLTHIWRRLDMSASQKIQLQQSNDQLMRGILASRNRLRAHWLESIYLLRAPEIDWETVRSKEAELDTASRDFQKVLFSVWTTRAKMLTSGQRAQLFAAVEEQMKSGRFFAWRPPEQAPAKNTETQGEVK